MTSGGGRFVSFFFIKTFGVHHSFIPFQSRKLDKAGSVGPNAKIMIQYPLPQSQHLNRRHIYMRPTLGSSFCFLHEISVGYIILCPNLKIPEL